MKKNDVVKKILFAAAGLSSDKGDLTIIGVDKALRTLGIWYKAQDRRSRYRVRKVFGELKRAGLIERSEGNEGMNITLTESGKSKAAWHRVKEMKLSQPKKWDKKWRIIIFDIPENLKRARNIFRKKLKEFGFITLQRSIWIYPYECRDEIQFLSDFLVIRQYVNLIEAIRLDGEATLKERFRLKK
ncbi:MAG: CRISPR-associated endonuclease Cas2 [Patescibacteria group bacterium]